MPNLKRHSPATGQKKEGAASALQPTLLLPRRLLGLDDTLYPCTKGVKTPPIQAHGDGQTRCLAKTCNNEWRLICATPLRMWPLRRIGCSPYKPGLAFYKHLPGPLPDPASPPWGGTSVADRFNVLRVQLDPLRRNLHKHFPQVSQRMGHATKPERLQQQAAHTILLQSDNQRGIACARPICARNVSGPSPSVTASSGPWMRKPFINSRPAQH